MWREKRSETGNETGRNGERHKGKEKEKEEEEEEVLFGQVITGLLRSLC